MFLSIKSRVASVALCLVACFLLTSQALAGDAVVKNGSEVAVHYVGKLPDDTVFDKSEGRGPLKFKVGSPQIIPGMSNGVIGMKVGDKKTINILPKEAYGEYDKSLLIDVPLKNLPPDVKIGSQLQSPQGYMVTVKELKKETAVIDANHFLAGKTLVFEITMVSIN